VRTLGINTFLKVINIERKFINIKKTLCRDEDSKGVAQSRRTDWLLITENKERADEIAAFKDINQTFMDEQ
jgi:hypothetical protein